MIWYLSPYSVEKNIGKIYNDQIRLLPDDSWICLLDQDVLFLRHDTKKQIEDIAEKGEYELYGCMTNRLRLPHQLHEGVISMNSDVVYHMGICDELHAKYYGVCEPTTEVIAGMLMLFRKETWSKVGGFIEKSIIFDQQFSWKVQSKAIMKGVYLFHSYRLPFENPQQQTSHLWNRRK